jgi:hypothetical protein
MSNETKNTFHLAITMAGAVSAGAYTAGVMDYLLEVLDQWEDMKTKQKFAGKLPTHNIKIEILSGASAGGMTACVSSIVLHQKDKHSVTFETKKEDRKKNRLYNSWVNLGHGKNSMTGSKAIFELFGEKDIKAVKGENVEFPISVFDSLIIRKIADDATELNDTDERKEIKLPNYVADNFNTFVTLTSLKGFKKTISLQSHTTGGYDATYTTTDHRDVMMFNFGEKIEKGVINVNLSQDEKDSQGLKLLRDAAVSTGAFPIGLEYGFIERKAEYINENVLMQEIHGRTNIVPRDEKYASAMIDGGLINNEPFELTEILLKQKIKDLYGKEDELRYSMLLIDPFPSDTVEVSTEIHDLGNIPNNRYPYSFRDAIGQLISVARTQLLVKTNVNHQKNTSKSKLTNMIEDALNQNQINTFLIAPRRKSLINGEKEIADGSKAIACGTLGGFGGFLDIRFREHDFFLGRNNCKSFLKNHFKFKVDKLDKDSPFYNSYSEESKKVFLIKNKEAEWLPIIPDVNILYNNENDQTINAEYNKNKFPQMTEEKFNELFKKLKPKIKRRFDLVMSTFTKGKSGFFTGVLFRVGRCIAKAWLLGKAKTYVLDELKAWKIVR